MLFLFIIPQIVSETFVANIALGDEELYNISNEYENASITISGGQALMLIEWNNSVVEFEWEENGRQNTAKFIKEVGHSFFVFKSQAQININFKSGISFYTTCMLNRNTDLRILFNNLKINYYTIDTSTTGYHIHSIKPFSVSNHPTESDNSCGFQYHVGSQTAGKYGYFSIGPFKSNLAISNFFCKKGTQLEIFCRNSFSTTVPTIIDYPLNQIVDNQNVKYNLCFGGMYNDFKNEPMSSLSLYRYVFIQNNIGKKPNEYNLTVSIKMSDGNDIVKEIKHGEIFSYAYRGYYSASITIKSKKGEAKNFETISGETLELDENNQPKVFSYDDSLIPDHIVVKDSGLNPGIIAAIVIAVVVVIAVIVIVVVIVLRKRKNNHSSQEGNQEKNDI